MARGGELPLVSLFKSLLNPVVVCACLLLVAWAYDEKFSGYYAVLVVLAFFISAHLFDDVHLFQLSRSFTLAKAARKIFISWILTASILGFLGYSTGFSGEFSENVILTWFAATPFVLVLCHAATRSLFLNFFDSGAASRSVVIVGANALGIELGNRIQSDPYLAMELNGYFDDRSFDRIAIDNATFLGKIDALPAYVRDNGIKMIFVSLPMVLQPRIMHLLDGLRDTTASVYFVPDIFVFDLIQARFDVVSGIPVMAICETPFWGLRSLIKRASDIFLATLILTLISPIMLLIAAGVKLSSPGPVIFKQNRYGLDGENIQVYKFRSMTVCENEGEIRQAQKSDKRITRFGAFLRKTSLDELPQFINVLEGKMSIVGPRPHANAHNEMYRKLIKGYMIRHKVKPGITGWAQVNGLRGETETVDKMKARIEHDLEYLRNWSLSLDLKIILKTIWIVIRGDRHAY